MTKKNEFCCYDEDGMPRSVDAIRMRLMEWNRMHSANRMLLEEDDEAEDAEAAKLRQHRVRRKEMIARSQTMDGFNVSNHLKIAGDETAMKILDRVRNKKRAKSTKTGKTDFGAFLVSKGLTAKPMLQRAQTSSFLEHREKCKERVRMNESKSRSGGGGGSGKAVVFQRMKTGKRKRIGGGDNDGGIGMKKRKMAGQ